MKNKNQTAKEKRGFTTEVENNLFISKSDIELISLLKSNNPKERTSSATILGQRKSEKAIFALCEQLKNEKALYSKIAISEALGKIGKPAINKLVKYLGKIGNNQHKTLPNKIFIKTDSKGNQQWQKVIKWDEYAFSALQTTDGSFIIAGTTRRHELESTADIFLLNLDLYGNEQWNRTISEAECLLIATCIQQTSDGGYIITGYRWDHDKESSDFLLMKTDFEGNMLWNKTFGGTENEHSYSVAQTTDGGYIIAGETWSYGAGKNDLWLVKTDPQGNMLWHNSFGGPHCDKASFVRQTFDNGYIIAGEKDSACGDGFNFWVIKLKADPIEPDEVSICLESIPAHPSDIPGFGVVFSIGNLLVVICLMLGWLCSREDLMG